MNVKGLHPAPDDEGGTVAKWEPPTGGEIDGALDKVLKETPADETEETEEKPVQDPKPEEKPETKEEEAKPDETTPKKYMVKGIEYTEEQIERALDEEKRGGMREEDYTRKSQANSELREQLLEQKGRLEALLEQHSDKATPKADRLEELLSDPDVPPSVAEALRQTVKNVTDLRLELDRRDEDARTQAVLGRVRADFDTTFDDLCKKHSVTDEFERGLIRSYIREQDPEFNSPDELRREVGKLFEHAHTGLAERLSKERKAGADEKQKTFVKVPNPPPSTRGGSTVPPQPKPKPAATLDDGSAIDEGVERINRLLGVG